jgi:recombination protein RecA
MPARTAVKRFMAADRKDKLEKVISAIQRRWGTQAIGRSSEQLDTEIPHIASGFAELDAALGTGGIPRGRISELMGVPTSGMTTVALKIMAQVQMTEDAVAYIDLERSFDPDYARRCDVLLDRLVLVHPHSAGQALDMLPDFVHNGGFDLLICDMPAQVQQEGRVARKLTSTLGRLLAPLSKSNTTLLFLTALPSYGKGATLEATVYPSQATLPYFATMRLLLQKERWLYRRRDVCGYEAQVIVVKNKLATPGKRVRIAITFHGAVEGGDL